MMKLTHNGYDGGHCERPTDDAARKRANAVAYNRRTAKLRPTGAAHSDKLIAARINNRKGEV